MIALNANHDLDAHLNDDAVTVFLFHGVVDQSEYGVRNYTGKHMQKDAFTCIIRHLSASGYAASMDELLAHVSGESVCPKRSFVITFDDGFWNNLSTAAPILEDHDVPATFFVTSDFVEHGTCSWTDRIEAAVASTTLKQIRCPYPLEDTYRLTTTVDRIRFLQFVRSSVKASRTTNPDEFADELVEVLLSSGHPEYVEVLDRKLNWNEVRQLDSHPLFAVGGHGQTHRILGYLAVDEMKEEVDQCVSMLRRRGGVSAQHFSYPEGFVGSYSRQLMQLLSSANIKTAVTTVPGGNSVGQDPFQIRRIFVA